MIPIPDVSVIIPTYNRKEQVVRAIESCKSESLAVQVIVVDDGSEEDIRKSILARFADASCSSYSKESFDFGDECFTIKYIYKANGGAPSARNVGLLAAKGVFIKFLDSDDELIAQALNEEVYCAKNTGADVVVTGWIERTVATSTIDNNQLEVERKAPKLAAGIDDMLLGNAPWTSAALYRHSSIAHMEWNGEIQKAQEWDWAWTVCLGGAKFVTLDMASAIYHQHLGVRITAQRNVFLKSTIWRNRILSRVEKQLISTGRMNKSRAQALVQYYYKDARVLCEFRPDAWRTLCQRFKSLAPGFIPYDEQLFAQALNKFFGIYFGVRIFVFIRKIIRSVIGKQFQNSIRTKC